MNDKSYSVKESLDSIVEKVMAGLTPFQRSTVNGVIRNFFEEEHNHVLVADEVGLGKTMVARGVIARFAKRRHDEKKDGLVKVVYICSNADIADQNIRKLAIDDRIQIEDGKMSRLSMQHYYLTKEKLNTELHDRYIQIIPLTPSTSFRTTSGTGIMDERALIYAVLRRNDAFTSESDRLKYLLWHPFKGYSEKNWEKIVDKWEEKVAELECACEAADIHYPSDVINNVERIMEEQADQNDKWHTFDELIDYCNGEDDRYPDENLNREFIVQLRTAFSRASIKDLEPDLVIMDEFQRFNALIKPIGDDERNRGEVTEERELADNFLEGTKSSKTRVLLLSATPFRLFSTRDEDSDLNSKFVESYQDFIEVLDFLSDGSGNGDQLKDRWRTYGEMLYKFSIGETVPMEELKSSKELAESEVSGYILRTERSSTGELSPSITENENIEDIEPSDILQFAYARDVMKALEIRTYLLSVDYAKSCPAVMSFFRGYKAASEMKDKLSPSSDWWPILENEISGEARDLLWLSHWKIDNYKPINIQHARYCSMRDHIIGNGEEQLLWVPPSLPYYAPPDESIFAKVQDFTKSLVFSSWGMVPKALVTLLSYEAEQKLVKRLSESDPDAKKYRYSSGDVDINVTAIDSEEEKAAGSNRSDGAQLPHHRLRFATAKDGYPYRETFSIVYPSTYLASLFPASLTNPDFDGTLDTLRNIVSSKIRKKLEGLGIAFTNRPQSTPTNRWYVTAILALDDEHDEKPVVDKLKEFADAKKKKDSDRDLYNLLEVESGVFAAILEDYEAGGFDDGSPIPADLCDVLADAAIGSPAVCALRAYSSFENGNSSVAYLQEAFEFGYSFMTRMNTPYSTLAIMVSAISRRNKREASWRNLLAYCCEGNLQSVLDEYSDLLYQEGVTESDDSVLRLHKDMIGVCVGGDRSPSLYKADTAYTVEGEPDFTKHKLTEFKMRTTFAGAFREEDGSEKRKGIKRRPLLRRAFNSPFHPFVLASTSVGQEGLDFHQYCRRVVHWNLPSNPIDFEQREGRINRYKSLMVRQNLAKEFNKHLKDFHIFDSSTNTWRQLFSNASYELDKRGERGSGLLPFWGVSKSGESDAVKIERCLYLYPFSADEALFNRLKNDSAKYRAVLGQPNQEELLRKLEKRIEGIDANDSDGFLEDGINALFVNLCPFMMEQSDGEAGN